MQPVSNKTRSWILFSCSLISLFLVLAIFMFTTSSVGGLHIATRLIHILADASMLMIPFWFLPQRWRWTVFLPLFIIPLWCLGSLWYYRFWYDIPAINSLFLIGNFNSELFKSTGALFRLSDIIILFPSIITLLVYLLIPAEKNKSADYSPGLKVKSIIVGSTLSVFVFSQVLYTRSSVMYEKRLNPAIDYYSATLDRFSTAPISTRMDLSSNGWTIGMLKSAILSVQLLNIHKQLSVNELSEIDSFIDSSPALTLPDSIRNQNGKKNVILIVVESLNSEAISMHIDGKAVAPTMLNMIEEKGTISALDIVTQVRTGGSGDGQLIINTGLLPLPLFSTSISIGSSNRFIALPQCLNRPDNLVIFGDDATSWNERNTFGSYGFKNILSNKDYQQMFPGRTDDDALLQYAASNLSHLQQPFFLELLTVSMHVPFQDGNIPQEKLNPAFQKGDDLTEVVQKYLTMVNFFDSALYSFIESLKEQGLYDNTILIIASDHAQDIASLNGKGISETPMAFIATNTGVTQKINRKVGQIDIFPTIIDICGSTSNSWKGLGTTMLNPNLKSAYLPKEGFIGEESPLSNRQQRAYDISENILRGNYFEK